MNYLRVFCNIVLYLVCSVMSLIYNLSFDLLFDLNFAIVCQIVYPSDGVPLKEMMGLEDFLQKLKLHLMEKVIYTKANNDLVINSEELPPVIAPVLRGSVVYNSENEKKSVFLKNSVASGNYTVGHTQDFEKDFGYSLE